MQTTCNREFKLPVSVGSSSPDCSTLRDVFLETSMLQDHYSQLYPASRFYLSDGCTPITAWSSSTLCAVNAASAMLGLRFFDSTFVWGTQCTHAIGAIGGGVALGGTQFHISPSRTYPEAGVNRLGSQKKFFGQWACRRACMY